MLLEATGISKSFGSQRALNKAQISLEAGEIHAIMGENGAGKSTLMKILSGVYVADEGEIRLEGQPIEPQNPRHALALGIGIVHQELSMVPSLTVGENIFPGRLPRTSLGLVKFKQLYQQAQV
ncbi:MAG: sugar ABC transporter ATP-binding protein, partial [Anaerolinea sp.]|nr:sugar ABC transporter ATP-binding protein [Anaerolinea sp.]